MKLFTTMKHNTVEWPKTRSLPNEIGKFFRGILSHQRFASRSSFVAIEIYVTMGLGISVSENEVIITIVLGICVGKLHLAPPKE